MSDENGGKLLLGGPSPNFKPNGFINQTGGPPNKLAVQFIRKDGDRLVITKDGRSASVIDAKEFSEG